ncbi:ankyrin repeat domain-containing protein [Aquimarina sp. 2201CG5-10]|uniref:ankyrin repeat domain-containing protein n=1 Tax=Aquimarina callyspongiae TaxID=3098150 RepID=UPI002AB42C04|nr:ankyrin repeat domain-containing protein [Aquimarina sp. 2201CG5-10]MDY8135906.1 ankyrin repeat domain-containing protein [Aquimarina sp. 2201CG5-10]
MITQVFNLIYCFITIFLLSTSAPVQEQNVNDNNVTNILGNWEGNIIVNEKKSIGILWRFEKSNQGKLVGFMGPASKGIANLPMQDIVVTDTTLKFKIHSEGSYSGKINSEGITGVWNAQERKKLVLNMYRQSNKEKELLKGNHEIINDIHKAIELGDVKSVKAFLDKDNDINKRYDKGYTLLFYAIKHDRTYKIAKYLLNQGADPNLITDGITPLMYAVGYRNHTILKELIDHKANANYANDQNQTALVFAIKSRDKDALQLLLDNGADPHQKLKDNYTAIDLAKKENIRDVLEILGIPYEEPSDGPYVTEYDTYRTAEWVYKGIKHTQKFDSKTPQSIEYNGMKATLWESNPKEVEKLVYNGDFKIAAVSDIHGQFDVFIELLQNHGIINHNHKWNFGNGHFVVTGDIFDRGPQVSEVLWFLYDLEKQAEQKGGKLHVLLGNHDVMVLNGNLRSVHPKYTEISNVLDRPINSLFTKGTVLGDWLRTRPVLVKINNMLFTHGGFHPDVVTKGLSIDQINREFKKQLIESELPESRSELGNYLHRAHGPIYYRGYFQGERATTQQIDQLLKHFEITNIIVGHTTHREIETRYKGKVIVIDANMKSGESGELLLWRSGEFIRGTLSGKKSPLFQTNK